MNDLFDNIIDNNDINISELFYGRLREKFNKTYDDVINRAYHYEYIDKLLIDVLAFIHNITGITICVNTQCLMKILYYINYQENKHYNFNWINTSKVTSLKYVFAQIKQNITIDISEWDVSNVKSFEGMFLNSNVDSNIHLLNINENANTTCMFKNSKMKINDTKLLRWHFNNKKFNNMFREY